MLVWFFTLQVAALVAAFYLAIRRAGGSPFPAVAATLVWLAATHFAAAAGWLSFGPLPPPFFVLVLLACVLATRFAFSLAGTRLVHSGLGILIGFQVFRVAVEIFLWRGHQAGFVPVQMTWEGRNLDILTGLTAPIVAILASRGLLPRTAILCWNIAGLALLINIVTVAIVSTPTPLRIFLEEPANTFVTAAPYIWLPAFLVPAAWLGHLLVFRRLRLA